MSVFLAIDLDPPVRAQVSAQMEALREGPQARWLRPDKLHCTLVFLGNPQEAQLAPWRAVLDELGARHRRFSLALEGAGTFVTARAPSVLWLGVGGALGALRALQADAQAVLGGEARDYVPHVTLARSQRGEHFEPVAKALASFRSEPFEVTQLTLYESTHHVYRVLHQSPLA